MMKTIKQKPYTHKALKQASTRRFNGAVFVYTENSDYQFGGHTMVKNPLTANQLFDFLEEKKHE